MQRFFCGTGPVRTRHWQSPASCSVFAFTRIGDDLSVERKRFRQESRLSTVVTGAAILSVVRLSVRNILMRWRARYFTSSCFGAADMSSSSVTRLLMMVAWMVLADASGCRIDLTLTRLTLVFLLFLVLPVITVPFLFLAHDVVSAGTPAGIYRIDEIWRTVVPATGPGRFCQPVQQQRSEVEKRWYLHSALVSSLAFCLPLAVCSVS